MHELFSTSTYFFTALTVIVYALAAAFQKKLRLIIFNPILISALVMFNAEPETFGNFFDAIYWATVSLTTVGYGDIYATSVVGKVITMISAVFGIAIVALPAGIITAGYMDEIGKNKEENRPEVTAPDGNHHDNKP